MSCERFGEAITDHACGAPIDDLAAAHLAGCAACRQALDEQQRLIQDVEHELRNALALTASPDLVASASWKERHRPAAIAGVWWAGAAAAAVIAVGVYIGWPAEPRPDPPGAVVSPRPAPPHSPDVVAHSAPAPPTSPVARRPERAVAPKPKTIARPSRVPSRPQPQREVIVAPTQARAIARLRELVRSGVLDDKTLPTPSPRTALVIAPLVVPEIVVPEIGSGTGPGSEGAAERD
ncbi:MAG: hypothetical protein ACRD15_05775 [Vicinamibacterales bacterium]